MTHLHLVADMVSLSAGMPPMRTMPLASVKRTPPSKSSRFSKVRAPPTKGCVVAAHCPQTNGAEARKRVTVTAAVGAISSEASS